MVGIDDIALHIPRPFLSMQAFAQLRGANFDKLNKGLGLAAMALPDVHEDTATMGANAIQRLLDRNDLDPERIGRIYLGTESALDGAKPTATYMLDMLRARYRATHGDDCFNNTDVVDLTFACIGAVDALHNTLDWVARGLQNGEDRIGIVVFSDNAKYELFSPGEYTQGAGAGALLVRANPRLLEIPDCWGVCTNPVHDFFKPRRQVELRDLLADTLQLASEVGLAVPEGLVDAMMARLPESDVSDRGLFHQAGGSVQLHRDTPVFDGPLSNRCYRDAVKQAFVDYRTKGIAQGRIDRHQPVTEQWARVLLHLPYAYQGKRMFPDVYRHDHRGHASWDAIVAEIGEEPKREDFDSEALYFKASDAYRRQLSKTAAFRQFVAERIEKGQRASSLVGNQYTGSLFLALMSTLEADLHDDSDLDHARLGLCGYGSGAKAKVFEARVQPGWQQVVQQWRIFERMERRVEVSVEQYEQLHRGELSQSVVAPAREYVLQEVIQEGDLPGRRVYGWVD